MFLVVDVVVYTDAITWTCVFENWLSFLNCMDMVYIGSKHNYKETRLI